MSISRDLERYAALFASRTKVMKSSAMRDLMAVTARPEVISLAGGLPDTSTFPPDTFAAVAQRIAAESCAKALQYGPTEGLDETKECIAAVMGAEGMRADAEDVIVTTGGQQVIDLVTKTLIDPGDVVAQSAGQQIRGVDEVRQRGPDEQAAGRAGPLGLARKVVGQGVEHRVAARPVYRGERVDVLAPAAALEVGLNHQLRQGRGAEVGGLLAEVDLLEYGRRRHHPAEPDSR